MNCSKCGAELNEGARFCKSCGAGVTSAAAPAATPPVQGVEMNAEPTINTAPAGAPVPPNPVQGSAGGPPPAGEPKKKSKLIPIIAGVAVLAVIIIVVAIFASRGGGGGGGGSAIKHSISYWYLTEDDETAIVVDGKLLDSTIDGDASIYAYSEDRSSAIISGDDNTLYYASSSGITEIYDDASAVDFRSGVVAYLDEDSTLWLHTVSSGKEEEIADDIYYFALSPDGKSVAYVNDDWDLFLYTGGKEIEIDDDVDSVISVSNGGKCLYYETKGTLYASTGAGKNSEKIKANFGYASAISKDSTELLFTAKGDVYYTKNGGEAEKVGISADYGISMVTPRNSSNIVDSVLGHVYYSYSNSELFYLDGKGVATKISKSVDNYSLTSDGKTLYYSKSNAIYKTSATSGESGDKLVSKTYGFAVTPDGKFVYYIDDDYVLYSIKGSGEPVKIASDVEMIRVTYDGVLLFIDEDDTLYSCSNGKDKEKIASDVWSVYTYPTETYYACESSEDEYESDIYMAKTGAKFELLLEMAE